MACVVNQKADKTSASVQKQEGVAEKGNANKTLADSLGQLAVILPMLKEEGFADAVANQGEKLVRLPPTATEEASASELVKMMHAMLQDAPSTEEIEATWIAYLKTESKLDDQQAREVVKKAKLSIFRLFFEVFGKDNMDLNGKIQMVNVTGLQVENAKLMKIQEGLNSLEAGFLGKTHFGGASSMRAIGIGAGAGAGGAIVGILGSLIIGAKFGAVLGPKGVALGAAIGFMIGIGSAIGGILNSKNGGKVDSGLDSTALTAQTLKQTLLSNTGQMATQEINTLNTLTAKTGQDVAQGVTTVNEAFRTMRQTNSVSGR